MTGFVGLAAGWFGPMFDEPAEARWAGRALLGLAGLLMVAGFLWIRRGLDPGPLSRGEARWRYRDRSFLERLDEGLMLPSLPGEGETRGWWITRIEFGIAITAILIGLLWLFVLQPEPSLPEPSPVPVPWGVIAPAAVAAMLLGLGWMVRIYRAGLRNDAQATWRYRDRQS